MEEELKRFIQICVSSIISVSYCYYLSTRIKAGIFRLISVLPVCAMFLVFPFFFSSLHISGNLSFFLSGTANLKLILFSFDQGPLFPIPPKLSQFISATCLPIKLQQSPKSQNSFPKSNFATKVALFGVLLYSYDYKQNLPPLLLFAFYSLQLYLEYEIFLTLVKVLVTITLGCNLEPQFNEPYLATSLQDFWSRRWNVMVPALLRPAVYVPVRWLCCKGRMSSDCATFLAVLATFIVSGVAHEVWFFTLTFEMPTGEVTCFFVLHGVCTAAEVALKRTSLVRRWRMSRMVSRLMTVGLVVVTGGLLFFPQLTRSGVMERRADETLSLISSFKRKFCFFCGDNRLFSKINEIPHH